MSDTKSLSIIQPPSALLITQTDPKTGKAQPAFPLQTAAWIKMQLVVNQALTFPLTTADFTASYGTFTDEGEVTKAVGILGQIKTTAETYGDPQTLISQIASFQQATSLPPSIYGSAIWLAAQTVVQVQQIQTLLSEGLDEIATENAENRLSDLTELLTGEGGISSYAATLQTAISQFETQTKTFYDSLNAELTGPNSLQSYYTRSNNILEDAKTDVKEDSDEIDSLTSQIHKLNQEYIGFTTAACASVLIALVPFVGPPLAVADAVTFGVLAGLVKKQMDSLKDKLSGEEADKQKKAALVTTLTGFNKKIPDVETDGAAFLSSIGSMMGGWAEFQTKMAAELADLTPKDLENWSAFRERLGFEAAMTGWTNILNSAEAFYTNGFVTFTTSSTT